MFLHVDYCDSSIYTRNMLHIFLLIAATSFIADLGDKTQLTIILLTHKTKRYSMLLCGVMLGFFLGNLVSVITGTFISHILPTNIIKIVSGIVFIIFGLLSLRGSKEEAEKDNLKTHNPFIQGFTLIFLSEFGDKSQIVTALFATKYNPTLVLISSMVGLFLISILTIYLSKKLFEKINRKVISLTAGALFIVIGLLFIVS